MSSILLIFSLLIGFQSKGQLQKNFWEHTHSREMFFTILDSCNENIFKIEFEYPFLLLLDEESKNFYNSLSSLEQRKRYLKLFWDKSNPNPLLSENELLSTFIDRCRFVKQNFSYIHPPYFDDRAKYYLKYGPPTERYTDNGGMKSVSLFVDDENYREIAAMYNGFPPKKRFHVLPNETWVYSDIYSDAVIHFVSEGKYFREVKSLTKALNSRLSKNTTWYWAELIKDRRALTQELAFLASEIDAFEDRFRLAVALKTFSRITELAPELRGAPHFKLTALRAKREIQEKVAKQGLPPAYMEPVKTRSQLSFSSDISQFRGANGKSQLKIALFAPIAVNFSHHVKGSQDTLQLSYRAMLRDHLFNPQSEIAKQRKFPLRYALLRGIDKVTGTLQTFSQPGIAELTLQFEDMVLERIGYTKRPILVRDFSGSQLMVSDIQLLREVLNPATSPALPSEELQGFLLTPYDALSIQLDIPVFCYFEIYNLTNTRVDGEIEISYTIRTERKAESFFRKITHLFKRSDRSSISLSYSKTVTEDMTKELVSLDVEKLKKGNYVLEITVRSKKDKNISVSANKIISILE